MPIKEKFQDVTIVDDDGNVEYVRMGDTDFFQVDHDSLGGTKVTQWYQNRSDTTSTLMQAVHQGTEALDYVDYLTTHTGRIVRQYSDTLCIMDGSQIVGAVEFAWYNPKKDIIFEPETDQKKDADLYVGIEDYIGESDYIRAIKSKIGKVADVTTPVFITGSTGTGKEMLARIIHNSGSRAEKEFVYVNCGALPENLLESILFGTAKGSFTGSVDKDGLFQTADGGTLFLDELNSMPLSIQGKLLRAIEEKRIRKVGDDKDRAVDVRIITSCNESTAQVLRDNSLRKDLFFRISSVQFELPDLNEREEDIPILCSYFAKRFSEQYSKGEVQISDAAMKRLMSYSWPGNIRELRNVLERAVYMTENQIVDIGDINTTLDDSDNDNETSRTWDDFKAEGISLKDYMRSAETKIIRRGLEMNNFDLNATCRDLEITRQSLRQKMNRLNIEE